MRGILRGSAAGALLLAAAAADPALAQKVGGVLKLPDFDSPASMSIHEESAISAGIPMMAVFNNLVIFDQHVRQNSLQSIVPDLAMSWSWNEDGTELSFPLRKGVKWHDGAPFTARDVKCTWETLLGRSAETFRINPRKAWYQNLEEVRTDGDYAVIFRLKRPQPFFLALLASGLSPVYPCHVAPRDMRTKPIGTGPFKFVEFKQNEYIKLTRNPDYWKPSRPYLDGIEYTIIRNVATRMLAFTAGSFDMTFSFNVSIPLLKDVASQAPDAICKVTEDNNSRDLIVNRAAPPFDNPDLRRAVALGLDRQAFIDILVEGQGEIGGVMQPPPDGLWGMPPEMLVTLPGYDPDVAKNRAESRRIMEKLGYGPDKRLAVTVSTRTFATSAAVILIGQLKEIYIDGQLEAVETANWYPKLRRKDFAIGYTPSEGGLDDPDQKLYEVYACGAERNYTGYCDAEVDKLIEQQSMQSDPEKRRKLVWEIDRALAEDGGRPILFYARGATCWQPQVKGLTMMVNSISNGWRFEDVWLDK
jgi:peptide/nickel transport system substrate-binding protein